jgi:hypothetical protein
VHEHAAQQAADAAPDTSADPTFELPETFIPMQIVDVVMVLPSTHPTLVLEEIDAPHRQLHIPIGMNEGAAIAYGTRHIPTPKPLTHELFATVLESFLVTVETVRITRVTGASYEAQMICSGPHGTRAIDCRPSDAVALALRQRLPAPIAAAPSVLDQVGVDAPVRGA